MGKRLLVCVLYFLFIAGCQSSVQKRTLNKIIVDGGGEFPQFLVGTWKANNYIWSIELGKKGEILSLVYVTWNHKIDMKQGYYYVDGPDQNTYAYFIMGPCEGQYNPITRVLKIKLTLNEYEIKVPAGSLKGRSEDYFEGELSDDGTKWYAQWRGFGYLDGAAPPDVNEINSNPEKIIFEKIEPKLLTKPNAPNAPVIPHKH